MAADALLMTALPSGAGGPLRLQGQTAGGLGPPTKPSPDPGAPVCRLHPAHLWQEAGEGALPRHKG